MKSSSKKRLSKNPKKKQAATHKKKVTKNSQIVRKIAKKIARRFGRLKKPLKKKSALTNNSLKKVISKFSDAASNQNLDVFASSKPSQATNQNSFQLPQNYGDNKIVLLVRDPWWIYAYWEITDCRMGEVRDQIQKLGLSAKQTVLRVYDVTDTSIERANSFFDIQLHVMTDNWMIDVGNPNRQWIVDLGIRTHDGQFFVLVRSNLVRTPRFGISDVIDEEWMMPDELYWKLFGMSGGFSSNKSSLDLKGVLERYLKGSVSSESLTKSRPLPSTDSKKRIEVICPNVVFQGT